MQFSCDANFPAINIVLFFKTVIPTKYFYVSRDLDSVEDSVRSYYESRGTKVLQDSDPNTTDLQKCIELLLRLDLPINQVSIHG